MDIILTEREKNVLNLLSQGLTNKEISNELHISVHTTKAHLESIYEKLNVNNRLQAVVRGAFLDLIEMKDITCVTSKTFH